MRKIKNPYCERENYACFGCAPGNPNGLRMEFWEDQDDIVSFWEPKAHFQGYARVLHGGIQASLMDEIASWTVFLKARTGGFTKKLTLHYDSVTYVDRGRIILRASLLEMQKNIAIVTISLSHEGDKPSTRATAEYFTLPEKVARQRNIYPGYEAFLKEEEA